MLEFSTMRTLIRFSHHFVQGVGTELFHFIPTACCKQVIALIYYLTYCSTDRPNKVRTVSRVFY